MRLDPDIGFNTSVNFGYSGCATIARKKFERTTIVYQRANSNYDLIPALEASQLVLVHNPLSLIAS